jgi:gliding motility-associated-like protein
LGTGTTVSNITFTGSANAIGYYANGSTTNIGSDSGIVISTGNITNAIGPNNAAGAGTNLGLNGDPQLAALIPGYNVYDAAVLEFDFVPLSDTVKFSYIFASEEYPEYVNSNFNDVFGFFISGVNPGGGTYNNQNIALIPGTSLPVSIDNVNNGTSNNGPCTNCTYYVNNTNGTTIQYDGFTTKITAWALVTPCLTYHIKIAIGDAGDHIYDSGVFLEAGSFQSGEDIVQTNTLIGAAAPNAVEGCNDAIITFTLPSPTTTARTVHYTIAGTATNGLDFPLIPDSVVFPPGSDSVSLVISPSNDGLNEGTETVILLVETSICTYDTVQVDINDYDTIQVNIPPVATACPNDTVTLTAQASLGFGNYQYVWNTSDSISSIQVAPSAATTYHVVVSDQCGFSDSADINLNVYTPAPVSVSPDSQWVCPGNSANITASGSVSYNWSPAASLSASSGANVTATPANSTTYMVIGTDAHNCSDTAFAQVLVYPQAIVNPVNGSVCPGDSILLTANTGITGAAYVWSTGDTTQSIYVQPALTSNYTVNITYPNTCTQNAQSTVQVYTPGTISINTSPSVVCAGDSVFVQASAASSSSYSWILNGSPSANTSGSFWLNPTTGTQIIAQTTDSNNCPISDTTLLTVNLPPNVTISSSNNSPCVNDTVQLTATGALTYQWTPAANLSATTGSNVQAVPTSNITYSVIGTDANQCKDSAQINLTVNNLPVVLATNDTGICYNSSVLLNVSGASSYSWTPAAGLNSTTGTAVLANPSGSATYIVTGTDTNGCKNRDTVNVTVFPQVLVSANAAPDSICQGDSTLLTASGAATYSWFPGTGLSATNTAQVHASPASNTTYQLIGADIHGCTDTTLVHISVLPLPNLSVITIPDICFGDTATLSASGAPNITWYDMSTGNALSGNPAQVSPASTHSYQAVGIDAYGCRDTLTASVTVNPLPNVSIIGPTAVCAGQAAILNASGALTYQWNTGATGNNISILPATNATYSVIGQDANGCMDSASFSILVNPLPVLNINTSSSTICSGSTATLNASSNIPVSAYNWSTGATSNSISVNPVATTTYTVSGTTAQGCSDSSSISISVNPLPNISLNILNPVICSGDTANLVAIGAQTYNWSPATSLTTANGSAVGAFPASNTTYTIVGTDTNGCSDTIQTNVTVNPLPILNISGPDTICLGDTVLLAASGANNYTWLPGGNGNNISVSPTNPTAYTVIGTDSNGCTDSISHSINVNPSPVLNINASSTHSCAGDSIQITASANMPVSGFNWTNGATGPSILVTPATSSSFGVNTVNQYGCSDSSDIFIQVNPIPNGSLSIPATNICMGDTINIFGTATGTGLIYSWNNGASVAGIQVSPTQNSLYILSVSDSIGCTGTDSAQVNVNPLPSVNVVSSAYHICAHDTVTISMNSTANLSSINWNTGSSATSFTAILTQDSTFSVHISDTLGCTNKDSVSILVNPIPVLSILPGNLAICKGDTITMHAVSSVNPVSFLWSTNSTASSITVSPASSTIYTLRGTDSIGCSAIIEDTLVVNNLPVISINPPQSDICAGYSVSLTASANVAGVTYIWNNGSAGASITVSPATSTIYQVTGIDSNGCEDTEESRIIVHPNPSVVINPHNVSICQGDSVLLNAATNALSGLSYLWSTGDTLSSFYISPLTTSSYSVSITDTNGCTDSDTMLVNVTHIASGQITAQSPVCSADSSIIMASGNFPAGSSIHWDFDGGTVLSGAGTGPLAVKWNSGGTYNVVLTVSKNNCFSEPDTQVVEVFQTPHVDFTAMTTESCGATDIQFVNNTPGMQKYFWLFNDYSSNTDTSSAEHPVYHYSQPGLYTVTLEVISPDGCPAYLMKQDMIEIYPNPVAEFSMDKSEIRYDNPLVNFYDQSTDAISWEWDFDDVKSGIYNYSTDRDPFHVFQDTGKFTVTLIVTTDHNCKDTIAKRITNGEGPSFYIPNAFTPNGDGINDTFFPKGTGYDWSTYEMFIYDRWGEMIYHTRDINEGWNGKRDNIRGNAQDDVYSYIILIKGFNGQAKKFVGKVVLFH